MSGFLKFPTKISNTQAKDTGMAMVLILLLVAAFTHDFGWMRAAVIVLIVDMIWPMVFYPVAVVWLGLSHIIGTVVSKILLSVIFVVLVTPVGLLRRAMSRDSLQLKAFKRDRASVMKVRNHVFVPADIEKPY